MQHQESHDYNYFKKKNLRLIKVASFWKSYRPHSDGCCVLCHTTCVVMRLLTLRSAPLGYTNITKLLSQKRCEMFTDGHHSCSTVLFKASTCNVAEALYLNKQFSHLFLISGATRWKAWHWCKSPFAKDRYGIAGGVMNIHIQNVAN